MSRFGSLKTINERFYIYKKQQPKQEDTQENVNVCFSTCNFFPTLKCDE